MSDLYDFVGTWTIRAVGGNVVWPFQLKNLVTIGKPIAEDTLPVDVANPEGQVLDSYQGVYSQQPGGLKLLTITGIEFEGATFTLAMNLLATAPGSEHPFVLAGDWIPSGTTITTGTWVGNEGGLPLPRYEEEHPAAGVTASAA